MAAAKEVQGIADDFAYCERLARTHYENFSVLSVFIPRELRPHFSAIYAFCRGVDDLGDEYGGDRLAALAEWRSQLKAAYDRRATHPAFRALAETIHRFELPYEEFDKLVQANEMDQQGREYRTFEDTLEYCRHSANPVGRLVLGLFGFRDRERGRLSDATCTALQLANFLQDTREDLRRGRNYWPQEDLARFGLSRDALAACASGGGPPQTASLQISEWGHLETQRTRELFRQGAQLEQLVPARLGLQLQLYRMGGEAVLDALSRQQFNPLVGRPVVSRAHKLRLMARAATGWTRATMRVT